MLIGVDFSNAVIKAGIVEQGRVLRSMIADTPSAGSAAAHFDLIEPYVREELRIKAFAPPLAAVELLVSDLGESAGVIGAAHLTAL